jgi:hypothetical protein
MPEIQLSVPAPAAAMPVLADAPVREDPDYPLGCECADPALQIPQWGQEARGEGA